MILFSVIIPVYNKEAHIKETIASVLNQTYSNFEIILVNDGSTDHSEDIILTINDSRIHYFKTKNQGVSKARNFGIEKAQGTYIAFLDADDYWYGYHLEEIKNLIDKFPQCGLYCSNYEFNLGKSKIIKPYFLNIPKDHWEGIVKDFFHSSFVYRIAWTSAVIVPKEVLKEMNGFSEKITQGAGEDSNLWIKIALKHNIAFTTRISARYNLNAKNRLSLLDTKKRQFDTFEEFLTEEKKNTSLKKYLDLYRTEFALKHKIAGDFKKFEFYKNAIDKKNLSLKSKLLLHLPRFCLLFLYLIKKQLERFSIDISAYH